MTDHPAIEATGLTRTYGSTTVLGGVDLRVAPGSVFSLLGPNGAGKTTMVRILSTLLRPDGGQARVAGFDIIRDRHRVRRSISLSGQYAALAGLQTGAEAALHQAQSLRCSAGFEMLSRSDTQAGWASFWNTHTSWVQTAGRSSGGGTAVSGSPSQRGRTAGTGSPGGRPAASPPRTARGRPAPPG